MRKIEKRAVICMALAILLAAGMSVFLIRYFAEGGKWASSAFNRHLYDSNGVLISGTVLDRDGDVLSSVENGHRTYYENETVRKATLHAVGDLYGKIGTGVLNAFADKLTGFDLVNGAFGAERGSNLYLTLDARYNYEAYRALGGHAGTVAVYNYKTGEILCMVSAPSYDPLNVPKNLEENDRYKGAYLNRFLSSAFVPGSVFKTVTLTAALENLPDAETRTWNCTGSVQIGDETITFPPKAETLQERYHLFLQMNRAKSRQEIQQEITKMEQRLQQSRQYIGQPKEQMEVEFSGENDL